MVRICKICNTHFYPILDKKDPLPDVCGCCKADKRNMEPKLDLVNEPPHYKSPSGIQAIDVIEAFNLNFRLGNTVKYILRHLDKHKHTDPSLKLQLQDLKKARWYLDREIAKLEGV